MKIFSLLILLTLTVSFIFVRSLYEIRKFSLGARYNSMRLLSMNSPPKKSKFDRAIDDFMGKRYGKGEAWYGKRMSDLSDDEYDEMVGEKNTRQPLEDIELKENSILIVGSLESVGQFIAFELGGKGFNIRVVSENRKDAISLFGLPGNNVDIIELDPNSDEKQFARCIQDVQAVIFCGNFEPAISLFLKKSKEYCIVASKLLDFVRKANQAKVGDTKKVIYLSRECQPSGSKINRGLLESFGCADATYYQDFRSLHKDMEQLVRRSGIDYCIVRAPAQVLV